MTKTQQNTVNRWIETIELWMDNGHDSDQAMARFSRECKAKNIDVTTAIYDHFTSNHGYCDCTLA